MESPCIGARTIVPHLIQRGEMDLLQLHRAEIDLRESREMGLKVDLVLSPFRWQHGNHLGFNQRTMLDFNLMIHVRFRSGVYPQNIGSAKTKTILNIEALWIK